MNKKYIISKNEEIKAVVEKGNKKVNKFFIVYASENKNNFNRYCVSVSKKIGNAVMRNKQKRTIKEILRKNNANNQKDYVIILRKEILNINYKEKEKNLFNIMGE